MPEPRRKSRLLIAWLSTEAPSRPWSGRAVPPWMKSGQEARADPPVAPYAIGKLIGILCIAGDV